MWKLSKNFKLLIGAATLWPLVYIGIFFVFIFGGIFWSQNHSDSLFFPRFMPLFIIFHFATMIGILTLSVFYIIDIMKNPRVSQEHKVYWVLGLFFGGMIVMPFYWYFNLWREVPSDSQNLQNYP